jgi:hypothetical protein
VEAVVLSAVLIFGFLVAAVLEEGNEDSDIGDAGYEESVEGSEKGVRV